MEWSIKRQPRCTTSSPSLHTPWQVFPSPSIILISNIFRYLVSSFSEGRSMLERYDAALPLALLVAVT